MTHQDAEEFGHAPNEPHDPQGKPTMKTYSATIIYTTMDIGREANSKEEYIESVKMQFLEENNIELRDDEIVNIEESDNE
jgi:hypothetical protein